MVHASRMRDVKSPIGVFIMNISTMSSNQFRRVIKSAHAEAHALIQDAYGYFKSLQNAGIAAHVKWYHFWLTIDKLVTTAIVQSDNSRNEQWIALKIIPVQDNLVITIQKEGSSYNEDIRVDERNNNFRLRTKNKHLFRLNKQKEIFWNQQGNRITVRL